MRTSEQKAADRAKRLWNNYRITPERYEEIARKQNHRCAICGRHASEFTQPLQVDHFHFKILVHKVLTDYPDIQWTWEAQTQIENLILTQRASTKTAAIAALKNIALPRSVRGLLCPGRYRGCNRLLGHVDRVQWLEKAITYLTNPPANNC